MPTHARLRAFLESIANRRISMTYQELAKALHVLPPHSIRRVTEALERLMEEDAVANRPFIAALAISKVRDGLPAPGFFNCARRLGRFADRQDARTFHEAELIAVFARWGDWSTTKNEGIQAADCPDPTHLKQLEAISGSGYPKFRNDRGVPEICIGVKEFECIGVSPPHDHPHVYINMREADTIPCPYCATQFHFDPQLTRLEAEPPDSVFSRP
jgi:uncharacterized Zn-finger protein